ncbi:hypothetical protein DDZ13_08110 [Coraliomargarita sinensis]|uniref:Uncharacterized protein n=1 Tax=Coraliomargarita sinensis TaxID=2174842 RepID=A0A317ZFA6_9BACT|nr:hypothetical protein [Coraliomargarita sinensis]PXA04000.1 hypothetical protein DDZ13_08110 [Coraliomargarita sinensis]
MEALLSNEFVVLALDALLHLASVFVLGIIVIIACKLLTKGFVDAKWLTGMIIALLLVFMRVFLLNNAHYLGGVDAILIMVAVGFVLFLTSLILVYKLVAIPVLGTILSSIVIVAAQLALAHYTPILSLKLMPEGQRFAEYAGVSNERTKQLMEQAKNFRGESNSNIGRILKEALATLAFLSSEKEQETLSKDLASGVQFIQERRAYMESMSEEELAEYRAAMSSFMQEQGVDLQNRYSLENLKNATPEDLENLANFMKDMNKVYGFTEDLPEGMAEDDDVPPTLDSIREIARNLQGMEIGGEGSEEFAGLLKSIIGDEDFGNEMAKVRGQIADLKANSGQLMETFRNADIDGMRRDLESATGGGSGIPPDLPPFSAGNVPTGRGEKLFSQNAGTGTAGRMLSAFQSNSENSINKELMDLVVFQETGYYPVTETSFEASPLGAGDGPTSAETSARSENSSVNVREWLDSEAATASTAEAQTAEFAAASQFNTGAFPRSSHAESNRVDYYVPVNTFSDFPEPPSENKSREKQALHEPEFEPEESISDFFPESELSNSLTDDYVLRAPNASDERSRWVEVANKIRIGAWYEGTGGDNNGTVFIDGMAFRSGEKIEREHQGEKYLFRFEGVEKGQVIITSLKREPSAPPETAGQIPENM